MTVTITEPEMTALLEAYDRGYFMEHPDDSEQEQDMKHTLRHLCGDITTREKSPTTKDPDRALAQLRDLVKRYGLENNSNDEDHEIALRMVEVFTYLDKLITIEGLRPDDWIDLSELDGG